MYLPTQLPAEQYNILHIARNIGIPILDSPTDRWTRPDQNRPKQTQTLVEQPTMQCNASLHLAYRTSSPNQTQLTSLLLLANWGPLSGNREPRTANPDGSRCVNCRLQSRCARLAVRDISLPRSFPSMAEEPGCSCTCVDVMFSALGRPARIGRDLCRGRLVRYSACGRKAGVGWEKKKDRGGKEAAERRQDGQDGQAPVLPHCQAVCLPLGRPSRPAVSLPPSPGLVALLSACRAVSDNWADMA